MCLVLACSPEFYFILFFFKQKTAYDMRISDWSSDVCSSDLIRIEALGLAALTLRHGLTGVSLVQCLDRIGSAQHCFRNLAALGPEDRNRPLLDPDACL